MTENTQPLIQPSKIPEQRPPAGFQLPPGANPLSLIFLVHEADQDKIGIILNESADFTQLHHALSQALGIVTERLKQMPPGATTPGVPPQQRHPKFSELLME